MILKLDIKIVMLVRMSGFSISLTKFIKVFALLNVVFRYFFSAAAGCGAAMTFLILVKT